MPTAMCSSNMQTALTGAEAAMRSSNTVVKAVWLPPPEEPVMPMRFASMSLRLNR